jgi:hypothetical protein
MAEEREQITKVILRTGSAAVLGMILAGFSGCAMQRCFVGDDEIHEELPSVSAARYQELLVAAKQRNRSALISFIRLAESNPIRAAELGYPRHLLQLARIYGDKSFADAISVFADESRVSMGHTLLNEFTDEFTRAYPQTLSSYQRSRTMSAVPKRLPPR